LIILKGKSWRIGEKIGENLLVFGVELFGDVGLLVHDANEKVGRWRERERRGRSKGKLVF